MPMNAYFLNGACYERLIL